MNSSPYPQPHCASYYAATANPGPDCPPLEGARRCDVCVVGGGFTGVSAALSLAERGYKVSVLEANRIGWGASGRNGGQLIGGLSGEERMRQAQGRASGKDLDKLLWDLGWAGHEIIRQRVERHAIDCDLKFGYMDAALKPRQWRELQEECERLQSMDFPHEVRLVPREDMEEVIGTRTYIGGLINMGNGHLHPLNLCLGEAVAAARAGAEFHEQSPVIDIAHGKRPKVRTERGEISCDFVILAGNAYHELEARRLGGFVFPAGSFIIATEPLSAAQARAINPLDLAVCDANHIVDYFRLSAERRLLFGGRCNYSGREPRSIRDAIFPRMVKVFPQLRDMRIDYEWGGKIGIVLNRVPHLGRLDKNIYYAQGYSGHGVNVTHLAGQLLADAITGAQERFDVFARVKHHRLPGNRWFGNQLVALGMLYFRLRDLL